ncbi:transposase [Methylocystis sp. B8]|jgi:transposase|uniref:IS66-like element accessory protein TnpA n=1 Tax=Methylocystis sp. B8 TaxID=544938 RepID=UPI0010FE65A3|nr:transposase [Methylocystis sp. B8]TLG72624.1 IS66 family insertion sequence element accessory protein TnpB [Methylocystis sp. B8]
MAAAKDGGARRSWSLEERQRIVGEALAPGASVAAVARRHGLNANLVFKWIRRAREGWLDRRRAPAQKADASAVVGDSDAPAFVPVTLVELNAVTAPALAPPLAASTKPVREPRRSARRGAMEISLPNGARVSLDADVDAEALRRVLSALGDL